MGSAGVASLPRESASARWNQDATEPAKRLVDRDSLVLSGRPADQASRRAAWFLILLSSLFFIALAPFAKTQLPAYPLFVPLCQTVLIVNDLVTAFLLFAQLRVTRSRALLVLACGYVFTALMALTHLLSFPGGLAPRGLIGGGAQTSGYLFVFWHAGFALFAIAYTQLKKTAPRSAAGEIPFMAGLALVVFTVFGLALLTTVGHELFPPMLAGTQYTSSFNLGRYGQWLLAAGAIVFLWRSRPHSVLDHWLLVVLFTLFIEIGLVGIFNGGRYDLGFYAGRIYGLVASCCVLGVLLWEQSRMYAGLLEARETARSEAHLRDNREALRLAMEGGRMGAWGSDLRSSSVWRSAELEAILGVPRTGTTSLREAVRQIRRSDLPLLRREIERAAQAGDDFALEICVRHTAGDWRWIAVRGHAVTGADGRVANLFGIGMDVTERHRGEAEASQVEARFQLLADGIPQLAWMARPDGHIYWYNQRWYEYTGKTLADMEGWGWQSVHDPEVLPSVMQAWTKAIELGHDFEMVFPLLGADGRYRSFLTRATAFRDAEGNLSHWFGTNTDITEQRDRELELRSADRRKDEFLATLAHELRNPLAPIRTAVGLMVRDTSQSPQAHQMWKIVDRQSLQLARLVDDLLDVSRITQRKVDLRLAPLSLSATLQDVIDAVRPAMEKAGLRLVVRIAAGGLHASGDLTRITQVFTNLLNNAAKFTPPGGTITVSARADAGTAVISILDDGIGIPRDHLERIFRIFSQVTPAGGPSQGGLGIGLALVRGLVELHGGTVEARSEGAGKGAEFVVRLPLEPVSVAIRHEATLPA